MGRKDQKTAGKVRRGPVVRLLDFTATWCPPCKEQKPILRRFGRSHPDLQVEAVDIDNSERRADRFRVECVPTLVFVNGRGTELCRGEGLHDEDDLERLLARARRSATGPRR